MQQLHDTCQKVPFKILDAEGKPVVLDDAVRVEQSRYDVLEVVFDASGAAGAFVPTGRHGSTRVTLEISSGGKWQSRTYEFSVIGADAPCVNVAIGKPVYPAPAAPPEVPPPATP
jgi:hypothetical protein